MAGIDLVGSANWDLYKTIMRNAQETFAKKTITWKRFQGANDRFMEDNSSATFTDVTLEVLLEYNAFRTWPVNQPKDFGEQDKENITILINKAYLSELGYINSNGNFAFDKVMDRFVFDGQSHCAAGDTQVAQGNDDGLFEMIIVRRDAIKTGSANP